MTDLDKSEIKECQICYQIQLLHNNKITLPCNHELCNNCLKKLRTETCPFCRTPFKKSDFISHKLPKFFENLQVNISLDYYIEIEEQYTIRERRIEINTQQRKKNFDKKYKYILSKNEKNKRRKVRKNHFRNNNAILLY
jgi:hypothetical protein